MSETGQERGMISVHEFYTLKEFMRRMGLTETAMRALRRKGFEVARVGKRAFVPGALAIWFLTKEGIDLDESESSQNPSVVFSAALGVSTDRGDQTEVSQNERQTES